MNEVHPTGNVDEVVHQRHRLGILVVLAEGGRADFTYLKGALALTDGNLGRHLTILEDAKLVRLDRTFEGRKARTWVSITPKGKKALRDELQLMKDLLGRVEP